MYADDVKFYSIVSTVSDRLLMQNDLDTFMEWCRLNDLKLNIKKCASMSYNRTLHHIVPTYTLENNLLRVVNDFQDLGVTFDGKLTFDFHISSMISRANSILGFLKRNSSDFKDPYTLKSLFCSIVRPILEYSSVVWNPTTQNNINRIERVQKNFLRFALRHLFRNNGLDVHHSYRSKCLLLGMQTLETRRKAYSVMFVRDILCGTVDSVNLLNCINLYAPSRALRQRPLLFEVPHTTEYGLREPICHCCKLFNLFYYNLDVCVPRNVFKSSLLLIISP